MCSIINKYISYPKINIGLDIYKWNKQYKKHTLKSIFVLIKNYKHDVIEIKKNDYGYDEIDYFTNNQKIIVDNDIISKTLLFLRTRYKKINDFFCIKIIKEIPLQSGLGGASSNSATIIKHLLKCYDIKLTKRLLLDIAINLGSDICFFLFDYDICFVSQYGNKIKPLNLPLKNFEIISNKYKCSTKLIFDSFRNQNEYKIHHNNYHRIIKYWDHLNNLKIINNLQDISFNLNPNLQVFYLQQKQPIFMTGSGSFFVRIKD